MKLSRSIKVAAVVAAIAIGLGIFGLVGLANQQETEQDFLDIIIGEDGIALTPFNNLTF